MNQCEPRVIRQPAECYCTRAHIPRVLNAQSRAAAQPEERLRRCRLLLRVASVLSRRPCPLCTVLRQTPAPGQLCSTSFCTHAHQDHGGLDRLLGPRPDLDASSSAAAAAGEPMSSCNGAMDRSNHCPGSVRCRCRSAVWGSMLHTGDLRDAPTAFHSASLHGQIGHIDLCYFDATFLEPSCAFPTKSNAAMECIEAVRAIKRVRGDDAQMRRRTMRATGVSTCSAIARAVR